jgi:hypothetical protein
MAVREPGPAGDPGLPEHPGGTTRPSNRPRASPRRAESAPIGAWRDASRFRGCELAAGGARLARPHRRGRGLPPRRAAFPAPEADVRLSLVDFQQCKAWGPAVFAVKPPPPGATAAGVGYSWWGEVMRAAIWVVTILGWIAAGVLVAAGLAEKD